METFLLYFVNQTDDALLVHDGYSDDPVWLPKSQIEYCEADLIGITKGDQIEINIPEWLAEEKGLP